MPAPIKFMIFSICLKKRKMLKKKKQNRIVLEKLFLLKLKLLLIPIKLFTLL